MVDLINLRNFCKKQPLYTDFIRNMAKDELAWLSNPTRDESLRPNEKQIERFHRVIIENGIVKSNSVSTSWIDDLKILAYY